jgi:hypothetical protein
MTRVVPSKVGIRLAYSYQFSEKLAGRIAGAAEPVLLQSVFYRISNSASDLIQGTHPRWLFSGKYGVRDVALTAGVS